MKKIKKLFHRWVLDSLIEKPPPLACILLCVFGSVFSIGFWCAHWIDEVNFSKYSKLYDVFSDNIGGYAGLNSMRDLLPIDVVYTWVNGSDPLVTENLKKYMNLEISSCSNVDCFASPYYTIEVDSEEDGDEIMQKNSNFIQTSRVKKGNTSKNFAIFLKKADVDVGDFMEQLKALKPNASIEQAFWSTDAKMDWSIGWNKGMIARLDTNMEIHIEISNISPKNYIDFSEKCSSSKHFDLVLVECTDDFIVKKILDDYDTSQLQTRMKFPKFWGARLILRSDVSAKELDSSRFEDNEELRYSLRSLEKFAPWIRKVFLVTNGQIPSWINLDHPRLSIITHDQIFPDLSHLPTFSSPAIETHIHRIPGLSKYFLYLNDDIILGDTVHPDDFFSPTSGYKVYLSWYIPDCASGCPGTWLGDGYCDSTCNTSACFWDGGDCTKPKDQQMTRDNIYDMEEEDDQFMQESEYCAPACSYSWLADTYCDSACSTRACGFDAGDCGTKVIEENAHKLILNINSPKDERLIVPKGELSAWMNIKPFMNSGQNETLTGIYSHSKGIAVGIFNVPLALLIFVFKPNTTGIIEVEFNITNKMEENIKKVHFHLQYNTMPMKKNPTFNEDVPQFNDTLEISNYFFDSLTPKRLNQTVPLVEKFSNMETHLDKESKTKELYNRYLNGELTDKGYKLMKQNLIGDQSILEKDFPNNQVLLGEKKLEIPDLKKKNHFGESKRVYMKQMQGFDDNDMRIQQGMVESKDHIENKLDHYYENKLEKNKQGLINKKNQMEKNENLKEMEINLNKREQFLRNRKLRNASVDHENNLFVLKEDQGLAEKEANIINNKNQGLIIEEPLVDKKQLSGDNDYLNKKVIYDGNSDIDKKKLFIDSNYMNKNITHVILNRKLMNVDEANLLLKTNSPDSVSGSFPWERRSTSLSLGHFKHQEPTFSTGRKLLDKYKDSLIYVNQLYNMEYGFQARKVPAHMPHFINKQILQEVQNKFEHEYQVTSSHKIREGNDMQFAFTYFYYLLSEKRRKFIDEIFDDYDTDMSGTWSDREIRSLLTKIYDLPLQFRYFVDVHNDIRNCSQFVQPKPVSTPPYERYADSDVPTVSKELVVKCANSNLWKKLEKLKNVPRFPHTVLSDSVVHFKMITSNVSRVVHHLDDIRKNSRKFICLNNNMDSKSKENDLVRALMQDTFESLFPVPSSFELPLNYRNRFSYVWQLRDWKRWKYLFRSLIYAFLSCLIILTLTAFFSSEIEAFKKRWLKRGRRRKEERLMEKV